MKHFVERGEQFIVRLFPEGILMFPGMFTMLDSRNSYETAWNFHRESFPDTESEPGSGDDCLSLSCVLGLCVLQASPVAVLERDGRRSSRQQRWMMWDE